MDSNYYWTVNINGKTIYGRWKWAGSRVKADSLVHLHLGDCPERVRDTKLKIYKREWDKLLRFFAITDPYSSGNESDKAIEILYSVKDNREKLEKILIMASLV